MGQHVETGKVTHADKNSCSAAIHHACRVPANY